MPRQPTGRPKGRPKGSGELGEQIRLTVRIPKPLYDRLAAFAEGYRYTRGVPQLAVCVREALEEYLAGRQAGLANSGQTKNSPSEGTPTYGQTEKYISGQTRIVQDSIRDNLRQTENIPEVSEENNRQTKKGGRKRSDLGERILTLLRSRPEGLSAEEIRVYLKPEKPIGDTLQGMQRHGKVRGVGSGQQKKYCLAGDG